MFIARLQARCGDKNNAQAKNDRQQQRGFPRLQIMA